MFLRTRGRSKSPRQNRSLAKADIEAVVGRTNLPVLAEALERRMLLSIGVFTVDTLADSGAGSLRQAITDADAAGGTDIINIAGNVTGTISLASRLPILSANITILGPLAQAGQLVVNGGGFGSVFTVGSTTTAQIYDLTISGGSASQGGGIYNGGGLTVASCTISGNTAVGGGGIFNQGALTLANSGVYENHAAGGGGIDTGSNSGTLITNCTISGNSSENNGGALECGGMTYVADSTIRGNTSSISNGGVFNTGNLTITNSNISGNFARGLDYRGGQGGGVYNAGMLSIDNSVISENSITGGTGGGDHGGGIFNIGTVNVLNSLISGNSADYGGGIYSGGSLTVEDSTISGNSAYIAGGGISNYGQFALTNSTVSGNSAVDGGGIFTALTADVTVTDTTISSNSASKGAGLYINDSMFYFPGAECTVVGTMLAANSGPDILIRYAKKVTGSNDLIGDGSDGGVLTNSLRGTVANPLNPQLAPLGDYGGLTQTMALLAGSPAIGAGANFPVLDANGNDITATDQRGVARPQTGIDIGAYQSGTLVVNTLSDPATSTTGTLSLREAIADANLIGGTDTITFAPGLTGTISVASELPALSNGNITIEGPGASVLTINGEGFGSVLTVDAGVMAEIKGVTITGGSGTEMPRPLKFPPYSLESDVGGGIFNDGGQLTINESTISGNSVEEGALYRRGGGVYNIGTLNIINSAINGNHGIASGGGVFNVGVLDITNSTIDGNAGGGVASDGGTATLANSTVSGNSAYKYGGISLDKGVMTITGCTISGNSINLASRYGKGGGIHSFAATLVIIDSTISGNTADYGGGIYNEGKLSLVNSTVSENFAGFAGGGLFIYQNDLANGGVTVTATIVDSTISGNSATRNGGILLGGTFHPMLYGTIIANNSGGDIGISLNSRTTLTGSNDLIGDGSDGGVLANSLRGTAANPLNPMLAPVLEDFGGPTQTLALLPGSPAIGAGANFPVLDASGNDITATDQRGFPRPTTWGIDIGADQGALFAGDTNFDGTVNLTDLLTLLNYFGETGKGWMQGDFNFDGIVNLTDMMDLLNNYGSTAMDNGGSTALTAGGSTMLTTGGSTAADASVATPAAMVLRYAAKSSPFASEPITTTLAGSPDESGLPALRDGDAEILQANAISLLS